MGPIPARIFWPGFCAGLLLLSLAGGVGAIVASQSDGGVQILDSYERSGRAPGTTVAGADWEVQVAAVAAGESGGSSAFHVTVLDGNGTPVRGLEGRLRLGRAGNVALEPVDGEAGTYVGRVSPTDEGPWDVTVALRRADGSDDSAKEVTVETRVRDES